MCRIIYLDKSIDMLLFLLFLCKHRKSDAKTWDVFPQRQSSLLFLLFSSLLVFTFIAIRMLTFALNPISVHPDIQMNLSTIKQEIQTMIQ
jgi:hypothetical protein